MRRASQLLETTQLSVQLIAEQVGYTQLSSFSNRYRKKYGFSPQQYRRNTKKNR